jgi:hypothetical protein
MSRRFRLTLAPAVLATGRTRCGPCRTFQPVHRLRSRARVRPRALPYPTRSAHRPPGSSAVRRWSPRQRPCRHSRRAGLIRPAATHSSSHRVTPLSTVKSPGQGLVTRESTPLDDATRALRSRPPLPPPLVCDRTGVRDSVRDDAVGSGLCTRTGRDRVGDDAVGSTPRSARSTAGDTSVADRVTRDSVASPVGVRLRRALVEPGGSTDVFEPAAPVGLDARGRVSSRRSGGHGAGRDRTRRVDAGRCGR